MKISPKIIYLQRPRSLGHAVSTPRAKRSEIMLCVYNREKGHLQRIFMHAVHNLTLEMEIYLTAHKSMAHHSGHEVWGMNCLRPFERSDDGFEPH
jgi:hypothetical protein